MAKWIKTAFPGIRYREHPSRKHGVRRDRYFTVRYKVKSNGKLKDREEGIGWASEEWTAEKAFKLVSELKTNRKAGEGPQTLAEKREKLQEEKEEQQLQAEREGETISTYFDETYMPWAEGNKSPNTIRSEKTLFNKWIKPAIGSVPFLKLAQTDTERLKKHMTDKGKAPKTVHLTLALIRQVYNHAKRPDIYLLAKAKMPKVDNAKLRYLTSKEIKMLLGALKQKSLTVHDQALLAVNTGMRFSEVTGLKWEDVNYKTGTLAIRDSKTGSRTVFINGSVREMLLARQRQTATDLVFPVETGSKKGQRQKAISNTFQRIADSLFNKGVSDRRLRVTFHTLRHSFGTHVYGKTGDLYLTQKALGHRTMVMAQRYAKMSEVKLREAFAAMTEVMAQGEIKREKAKEETRQILNFPKGG